MATINLSLATRTMCVTAIALAILAAPAGAGKNAGCAFIVHTDDAINYTYSHGFCDSYVSDPGTCTEAVTTTNKDENTPALIWCFAAFPEAADPAVTIAYFGLNHNLPPGYILDYGFCGTPGTFELPSGNWPDDAGSAGVTVAFGSPIEHDILFPFYWFAAYGYEGRYLGTASNPVGEYAAVLDNSSPAVPDTVTGFGLVRWYDIGFNECPDSPPAAPSNLTAEVQGLDSVLLQWQDNSNKETGFEIYRKTGVEGTWGSFQSVPPDTTRFVDDAVMPSTTYYYQVRALGIGENSAFSNQASAMPGAVPAAPTELVATAVSPVGIDLTWLDNADNELGFNLERMEGLEGEWITVEPNPGANIESFEDRRLNPATLYQYRIRAYNEAGHSNWSDVSSTSTEQEPPPQNVDFVVFFGTTPVEEASVLLDSGAGFVQKGTTDADGRLTIPGVGIGDRIRAVKKIGERPAQKSGHEAVDNLMYELWLDSDLMQPNGTYEPLYVETLESEYHVSLAHPLFKYNLVVSVDWDIPAGNNYWGALETGFNAASNYLYNVSDGQMVLGSVAIYDKDENRLGADVRVELGGGATAWSEGIWKPVTAFTPARITLGQQYGGSNPDGMRWYRSLVRLFGTYALGLVPEYKNARGLQADWISYRRDHPEECPANYGAMDYPLTTTEMSSANDYTRNPAQDWPNMTAQLAWTGCNSWDWAELQMERLYAGIDVKKPLYGWYPDNVTPDRLGPTDDLGLAGEYSTHNAGTLLALPLSFKKFDSGEGSSEATVTTLLRGRATGSVQLYKFGRTGPTYVGETGADGSLHVIGLEEGDHLKAYYRCRNAVLAADREISTPTMHSEQIEINLDERSESTHVWFGRDDLQAPGAAVDTRPHGLETEPEINLDIWSDEPLGTLPQVRSIYGSHDEILDVVEEGVGEDHFTSSLAIDTNDPLFDGQGYFEITLSDIAHNESVFISSWEIARAQAGAPIDLAKGSADAHIMGDDVVTSQLALVTKCNTLAYIPEGFAPIPLTDLYSIHLAETGTLPSGAGLNITYDDSAVIGLDETSLAIFRWDDAGRTWVPTGSSHVAPSGDVVSAPIFEGGTYCVFATSTSSDTIAPAPVASIGGIGVPRGQGHVELDFVSSGDDGTQGRAMEYIIAFGDVPFTEEEWPDLPKLPGLVEPAEAGTRELITIVLPEEDHLYYIGIRVKDESGNLSPLSDLVRVVSGSSDPNALPAPPTGVCAVDAPADSGGAVALSWQRSSDDGAGKETVVEYRIYRNEAPEAYPILFDTVPAGTTAYVDSLSPPGAVFTYWVSAADSLHETFGDQNSAFSVRNLGVPVGDFTSDGVVGINDFGLLVNTYAIDSTSAEFDPLFDLDVNGDIYAGDFAIFSDSFGVGGIPDLNRAGQNADAAVSYTRTQGEANSMHLDLAVSGAVNLAGYSLKITFDPDVHPWLGAIPDSSVVTQNILTRDGGLTPLFLTSQPSEGVLWIANAIKKPLATTSPEGDGFLGRITFEGPLTFEMTVSDIVFLDHTGQMDYQAAGIPIMVEEGGLCLVPMLYRSHPNPFCDQTTIGFTIPQSARVDLKLYDTQGRLIRTLVGATYEAGIHSILWDGKSNSGDRAASGIYFYRLETPGFDRTRKVVLLR